MRKEIGPVLIVILATGCPGGGEKPDEGELVEMTNTFDGFTGTSSPCTDTFDMSLQGYIVSDVSAHGSGTKPPAAGATITHPGGTASSRSPSGSNGNWDLNTSNLAGLRCSTESCGHGTWTASFTPPSAPFDCSDFNDVDLTIWATYLGGERNVNPATECTAGSGTFMLLPMEYADENGNGYARTLYKPIQIDGTGVMTNAAWVTQIDVVDNGGHALKVLKANRDVEFTSGDLLADTTDAYSISTTHSFSTGSVSGIPEFIHPPIDPAEEIYAEVEMEWECGGALTYTTITQPAGYQFALDDIGCPGIQKFTMRPSTTSITWELYGDPTYTAVTPIDGSGNFTFTRGLLEVDGKFNSIGLAGASVTLNSVTYDGTSVCTTGTYTLPPE